MNKLLNLLLSAYDPGIKFTSAEKLYDSIALFSREFLFNILNLVSGFYNFNDFLKIGTFMRYVFLTTNIVGPKLILEKTGSHVFSSKNIFLCFS